MDKQEQWWKARRDPSHENSHNSNLFNGEPYWKLFYVFRIWYRKGIFCNMISSNSLSLALSVSFSLLFLFFLASSRNRLNSLCKSKYWFFIIFVVMRHPQNQPIENERERKWMKRRKKNNIWSKAVMSEGSSSHRKVSKVNYRKSKQLLHKS